LPLAALADTGGQRLFSASSALETLIEMVDAGAQPRETRLKFARGLNRADRFGEALESIAAVLAEHPNGPAALTLNAHILASARRLDEAERLATALLARVPTYADAWDVLRAVYRTEGRWSALEGAATQALNCEFSTSERARVLADRARARIELGAIRPSGPAHRQAHAVPNNRAACASAAAAGTSRGRADGGARVDTLRASPVVAGARGLGDPLRGSTRPRTAAGCRHSPRQ
jgi:predicted Zn-dependent protease